VLAAGTAAQAGFSAVGIGLPVLAPALRDRYDLSVSGVGVVLAAGGIGTLVTLVPWGLLTDRTGERRVLAGGLGLCALLVAAAAFAPGVVSLVILLALAGAAGASVSSASGSAVMRWFEPEERGLALGVRQTAIPAGGLVAALVLPVAVAIGGTRAALLVLAALCGLGALVGAIVIRDGDAEEVVLDEAPWTLRDSRLWRLSAGSGLLVVAQVALIGFMVLFLHDERGFSTGAAAGVLAAVQVLAVILRIGAGRLSDVLGARIAPLRWVGLAIVVTLALCAALVEAPAPLLVPALVVAGSLSMAWNGLSFAAAAELAGRARSGSAIGVQQSALAAMGAVAPIGFAAAVSVLSWRAAFGLAAAFPLAGWWLLGRLNER